MATEPLGDCNLKDEFPPPPKNTWVEHIQQLGLHGIFTGGIRKQGPIECWEVECGPGDRRWIPKQFLRFASLDDPAILSLLQLLERRRFANIDVLRRLMTHEKLRGTLTEVIYSMDAAQIEFYPYQFKPVLKFIESPSDRLVLADEVGLGKTIEAALIWLELRARRQARRLLVVCHSAMLAEKWRRELREKFEIEAMICDFSDLQSVVDDVEKEGPSSSFAVVVTYSGIRPSRRDAHRLDSNDTIVRDLPPKAAFLRKLRQWEHTHAPFDLVSLSRCN